MLRIVVFLGGAVLMALEIIGSRVLNPHFGSSVFVWGSLISIFLSALSLGYWLGGRLADRSPSLLTLGLLLCGPGLLVTALPFYSTSVLVALTEASLGPRAGPLLAALVLFFVPSVFLGTLSPYAIKLEARSLATVGNTAGQLYALSTAGSIAGTLGATFVLIPAAGVRSLLHGLGLLLLVLSLAAVASAVRAQGARTAGRRAVRPRGRLALWAVAACAALAGGAAALPGAPTTAVYEKESLYHQIRVEDRGSVRYLRFDRSWQSAVNLDNPHEMVFDYIRYFHLGMAYVPDAQRALFVGLGGGTAPRRFRRDYPQLLIDVAELDPEVIRVARRFFFYADDPRLRTYAQDGRLFLRTVSEPYDLIFLDAYFEEQIPFHLATREFLQEVATRLAPDGAVVANVIGALRGRDSRLFRAMLRTYREVFPEVDIFPVGSAAPPLDMLRRNIILVASRQAHGLVPADRAEQARELWEGGRLGYDVTPFLRAAYRQPLPTDDVPVLVDDYAPVDALQHF